MTTTRVLLSAAAMVVALAACNRQPPVAPVTPATTAADQAKADKAAKPVAPPPAQAAQEAVTVAADAVTVGSTVGADGAAATPKPAYALADTVYASASARGHSGATARAYWTYQDGTSTHEEEKPVAGDVVSFSFSKANGMKPGTWNGEIDFNDVPVGIADFKVQ
jgi:hypothetical protein